MEGSAAPAAWSSPPVPLNPSAFRSAYADYCKRKGMTYDEAVDCLNVPINLYDAFCTVFAFGGCKAVGEARIWSSIVGALFPAGTARIGAPLHLRGLYEDRLMGFENYAVQTQLVQLPPAVRPATPSASGNGGATSTPSSGEPSGGAAGASANGGAAADTSAATGPTQALKRRRSSNSPSVDREGSPASSGRMKRENKGGKTAFGGARPSNHQLDNRAILPPHGRGRAPKVLPPTLMRRVAVTPPPGSPAGSNSSPRSASDPRAAAAAAAAGNNGSSNPRASGDPRRAAAAAGVHARAPSPAATMSRHASAAELSAADDSDAGPSNSLQRAVTSQPAQGARRGRLSAPAAPAEQDATPGVRLVRSRLNSSARVAPYQGEGRMPVSAPAGKANRARWQLQGYSRASQSYGEEPLGAMVAWLRDAARQMGHCSPWAPPVGDFLEGQTYQQGLLRWREAEYVGLEPPPPPPPEPGHRRSGRNRAGTQFFVPSGLAGMRPQEHHKEHHFLEEDSDDEKETREGKDYQADLPPLRPKPKRGGKPPPDEAVWLTGRILGPRQLSPKPSPAVDLASMPLEQRMEVEDQAVRSLRAAVGPYAGPLGLDLMGAIAGRDWTDQEAALLEEGMRLVGRDFRRIAVSLLPGRRTSDLILYYYNVWKTKSTPRARAWFHALEQARLAEEAEEAAERAKAAEMEAKRLAAQAASVQARQMRDALSWLRASARWPKDSLPRPKAKERASRITVALAATNMGLSLVPQGAPRSSNSQ